MRAIHQFALAIILTTVAGAGCASKPSPVAPADQAAIRDRLNQFNAAWDAANPEALRESFHVETPERRRFVEAAGRLRVARANLAQAQRAMVAATSQPLVSPFSDLAVADIPPYFAEYARGATEPGKMQQLKQVVTVALPGEHRPSMRLSKDDAGGWKINPASLAANEPLPAATARLMRQAAFTDQATAAVTARDAAKMKSILQRFAQQELVDRISQAARQEPESP